MEDSGHDVAAKAIAPERDRLQSRWLTLAVVSLLVLFCGRLVSDAVLARSDTTGGGLLGPILLSAAFALLVLRLRAATPAGAAVGAMVCLLMARPGTVASTFFRASPLPALIALFVLTFAATRFRRAAKERSGLAEARSGRRVSQVVANLGVAGLCAGCGWLPGALAALAEATADTVASEVGQALGGPTFLLTTGRRVGPGTDGGISLRGTLAGLAAAGVAVLAGIAAVPARAAVVAFVAGAAGLLFDSLLGATLERRGWIGNDVVNFSSTLFAAALAEVLWRV